MSTCDFVVMISLQTAHPTLPNVMKDLNAIANENTNTNTNTCLQTAHPALPNVIKELNARHLKRGEPVLLIDQKVDTHTFLMLRFI